VRVGEATEQRVQRRLDRGRGEEEQADPDAAPAERVQLQRHEDVEDAEQERRQDDEPQRSQEPRIDSAKSR
jgi:hypothetical protein